MADVLEYIVRLRGGPAAAAEVRGLAREFTTLSAAETKANATGAASAAAAAKKREAAVAFMTKTARVGAIALAATAFEAVKMSNTYDTEMLKIRTDAGATTSELNFMRGAVLDLAKSGETLGASPQSLAMGLYHLESLGIRGQNALTALKLAAQGAAISGADLEETTSALGAAMFVGIKGAGSLEHIMGLLNATVGAGNMRMGELVHSLGTGVLSSAKVAGLGIGDVMSALAVFSDAGQSASSAAAQFATALHFLYAPTDKAAKALDAIGLGRYDLAAKMRGPGGMVAALKELRDHLEGLSKVQQAQILSDILPGGRGRVLLTELTMLDRATQKWQQIQKTTGGFRESVEMQKHNPATVLKTAVASAQASLIEFGHKVGPVLMPVLGFVIGAFGSLIGLFAKVPAIPVILFIGLLTLGMIALARRSIEALASLVRYALGLAPVTAETTAAAAATAELAAAQDAAAVSSVGLLGKLGGLATGLMGIMRYAGPVGAFLYGLGLFNPDSAGDPAAVENAKLAQIRAREGGKRSAASGTTAHDLLKASLMRFYGHDPAALEQDLRGGMALTAAQRSQLRRYFSQHHLKRPPLLAAGGVARVAGSAIVGDAGPELLDLPEGAQVTPLRGAGWRYGDVVVQIDKREVARALRSELIEQMARGG